MSDKPDVIDESSVFELSDFYKSECAVLRAEVERLRLQHDNDAHTIGVGSRANAGLEIEVQRLRAALDKLRWADPSGIAAVLDHHA